MPRWKRNGWQTRQKTPVKNADLWERLDQAAQAMAGLAARWDQRLNAIKRLAEAAHAEAKQNKDS